MKSSNHEYEMYILVGNRPIKEYFHESSTFVEGRAGSEYTVRIRNSMASRACFVLSIDGLSVLDGQQASDKSPGYVLNGGETLDVLCYKVDDGTGAKFMFGTKDESYSAQIGKGTDNVGVIAAKVFHEKLKPVYSVDPGWVHPQPWRMPHPNRRKIIGSFGATGLPKSVHRAASAGGDDGYRGIVPSGALNVGCSTTNTSTSAEQYTSGGLVQQDMADEKLGTVFGDAVAWQTHKVEFERASALPNASLVVYYDTKKNLERRGIKFHKETAPLPNPFPGNTGCPTPSNWRR